MKREFYRTVSDFLDDPQFRNWVLTGIDENGWEEWIKIHPDRRQLVIEARNLLLAMGVNQYEVSTEATEEALRENWDHIRKLQTTSPRQYWLSMAKYAAAVIVILLGFMWYHKGNVPVQSIVSFELASNSDPVSQGEIYNNTSQVPQLINLKDGSSVILQPGGTITCAQLYDSTHREVYLKGEAFFEVKKNPNKPFLVYTGDIVARVVGTSFRIKAIEGDPQIEVFVKTGEVNISQIRKGDEPKAKEIALYPNESVSFLKERNIFEKAVFSDIPKRAIEYLSFEFVDTHVTEIFKTIEKAYGVRIDYPVALLADCYLSTSLTDEPLLEKLKIICESMGENSSFTMHNNQIKINSNGCN